MLANDYSGVLEPKIIVLMVLVTITVIVLGVVLLRGFNALALWLIGWKRLTRHFPVTEVHPSGEKYRVSGRFANVRNVISGFKVEFAPEGMLVTPDSAKTSPILVSWSDIDSVLQVTLFGRSDVMVAVQFEEPFHLHFPSEAVPALQRYVPAERFRKEASLGDLIRNRMNQRQ